MQIQGKLLNGTQGAPADSVADREVTLFQITERGPVTRTVQTDSTGSFQFTDVLTDANAYFTRVDYAGVRYYSEIRPPELATASPITVTLYETSSIPADFSLERVHLIFDVQPKRFNGLVLLQLVNPTDRVFFVPLPVPNGARDVQFDDFREQTRVVREDDGTILYPVLPTTSEVVYSVAVPFTPPDFQLEVPLENPTGGVNLLISKLGGVTVSGSNLTAGEPFVASSGQEYLVYSSPPQAAGSTFSVKLSNLAGVDNTRTLQTVLLVAGGLGALALLAFPVYRRRTAQHQTRQVSGRVAQLQALAQLDDAFEAGELEEGEYYAARAALKAELLKHNG